MGVCLTVFWAMRTPLRIGPNRSRCCNFIPSAAKLAQAVNWLVGFVVDSFMMMVLLSQVFFPLIGKIHHRSFRKSLCFDSSLSLFWTKFRYLGGVRRSLSDCCAGYLAYPFYYQKVTCHTGTPVLATSEIRSRSRVLIVICQDK